MDKSKLPVMYNPLRHEKETKLRVQEKLKKRREIDESRRERRRLKTEETRQKKLDEKIQKSTTFSKTGEKERRSWILGVGNISPTSEGSPKIDARRKQYNKAMKKMSDSKKISFDVSSDSSSSPELKNHVSLPLPSTNHEDVYHSSQFHVSSLIPAARAEPETLICRICQSDEDSLINQLVTPCNCTGSLRYVHHLCLQQWRKTKKASGADITKCELCLSSYNTELLGKTDVKPDQTKKMQEDLRRLVRSGVYLMLLVDFCRDSFQNLLQERETVRNQSNAVPVEIHPTSQNPTPVEMHSTPRNPMPQRNARSIDTRQVHESSSDNDEYVSRSQLKQRSERHSRRKR